MYLATLSAEAATLWELISLSSNLGSKFSKIVGCRKLLLNFPHFACLCCRFSSWRRKEIMVSKGRWSNTWSFRIIVQHFVCLKGLKLGKLYLDFLMGFKVEVKTSFSRFGFSSPGELTVSLMLFGGCLTVKTHVALRVRVSFHTPANIQPVFWSHICANRTSFAMLSSSKIYRHSLVRRSCPFLGMFCCILW